MKITRRNRTQDAWILLCITVVFVLIVLAIAVTVILKACNHIQQQQQQQFTNDVAVLLQPILPSPCPVDGPSSAWIRASTVSITNGFVLTMQTTTNGLDWQDYSYSTCILAAASCQVVTVSTNGSLLSSNVTPVQVVTNEVKAP